MKTVSPYPTSPGPTVCKRSKNPLNQKFLGIRCTNKGTTATDPDGKKNEREKNNQQANGKVFLPDFLVYNTNVLWGIKREKKADRLKYDQ